MARKAKLKSTGEIIEVYVDMDYHGNTTWLDTSTKTEYCLSELEFLPEDSTPIPPIAPLSQFTDEELKDELKRREKERRSQFPPNLRCRDCKHCIEGLTFKHQVIPTTVCKIKPKPSQGPDRYFSTVCSYRACDKFEVKTR
ncbi:MAG: hypothetical protein HDS59_05105 [Barnesiella sp.]|nr:hypothetical protein [Barnesiella sp.]